MTEAFPHIDLAALIDFTISAALVEHAHRFRSNGSAAQHVAVGPAKAGKSGKGKASSKSLDMFKVNPKVKSCKDIIWAGEKMIDIEFEMSSLPMGPFHVLAFFPKGRVKLTTQSIVGATTTIRLSGMPITVPKIYAFRDAPEGIGAEVVLFEKIPGESLNKVWPKLNETQRMCAITKVAEISLSMFHIRFPFAWSALGEPDPDNPVLLSKPFDQGPLKQMEPQQCTTTTHDYLLALADRIETIFNHGSETVKAEARNTGWSENPVLTDRDIQRVRATWHRLASLIPYHTGGFFLPKTLSPQAYESALSVMQSREFGIVHTDMQMCRYIVHTVRRPKNGAQEGELEVKSVTLTGWEHAYHAPLWSCARMPEFLLPGVEPDEPLSWERQRSYRLIFWMCMTNERLAFKARAWQWAAAYVYGRTERWFENCLSSHWMFRDYIEVSLTKYKTYWESVKPDVPFPIPVGAAYIAPGDVFSFVGKDTKKEGGFFPDAPPLQTKKVRI